MKNYGICPFCGQTQGIETSSELEPDDLQRAVIARCGCEGAVKAQDQQSARSAIETICGEGAVDFDFRPLGEQVCDALHTMAWTLYGDGVEMVNVIAGGDKIKMRIKGGKLSIERKSENKRDI